MKKGWIINPCDDGKTSEWNEGTEEEKREQFLVFLGPAKEFSRIRIYLRNGLYVI